MREDRQNRRLQAIRATGLREAAQPGDLRLAAPLALARGRLHEALGEGADSLALAAAAGAAGPLVWIGLKRDMASLAPTGLQGFADPARFLLVSGQDRSELLWAAEQALRARAAPCVILELKDGPDLRESRRLQLAAGESGALGLVLVRGQARTSAAETRWQCDAAPGGGWTWICTKRRRGPPGAWHVSWKGRSHAPDLVALAAPASA